MDRGATAPWMPPRVTVWALTTARVPLVALGWWAALAGDGLATVTFGMIAVATDMADGILARRWGVTSKWGSNFDSAADLTFYTSLAAWVYVFEPAGLGAHLTLLGVFFGLYCVALLGQFLLRGTIAVHDKVSRAAGTVGGLAGFSIIAFGYTEWLVFTVALFATADLAHRLHSIVRAIGRRRLSV